MPRAKAEKEPAGRGVSMLDWMEDDVAGVVTPTVGDLLADRYSLAAHIDDDSSGRQVWRGMDILLNRPVTVVLRTPGGAAAEEMLTAAVAASHVNHPNVVGVYDAVDQGDCAYVVREWVEGQSLRDAVSATTRLSCDDAVSIIHCVSDAVAAVHATGVAHGNVHPGTILLSDDDRVVLTDPRADAKATIDGDLRAVGASLYCALTGTWPRTVDGPSALPDAETDSTGRPVAPDLLRDDVPPTLNTLVVSLIDPGIQTPTATDLADQLSKVLEDEGTGALALVTPPESGGEKPSASAAVTGRRLAFGAAALVGLALIGLLAALILIPSSSTPDAGDGSTDKTTGEQNNTGDGGDGDAPATPVQVSLETNSVSIIDPDGQDDSAKESIGNIVDGDSGTSWKTSVYYSAKWGNLKPGMGILIDLGEERQLSTVHVKLADPGAVIGLYAGTADGGLPTEADALSDPMSSAPTDATFTFSPDTSKVRYLVVWCTDPPVVPNGFQWVVNEIEVFTQ